MRRATVDTVSLGPLFATLLASLTAPACHRASYNCFGFYNSSKQIPAVELAPYLKDGKLDTAECKIVCKEHVPRQGTRNAQTSSGTGDSTSTSGTSSSSGTSSTSGTSGSTDTSSGTAGSTTGETTTTGTDTLSSSTVGSTTTTSPSDTEGDYYSPPLRSCSHKAIDADTIELTCQYYDGSVCGRRPLGGFDAPTPSPAEPELSWLLAAYVLEAASVPAFEELAAELARHGAPEELRAAALRAADDECRHAARVDALVRRRGGVPSAPRIGPAAPDDLEALARHNAVEGCVRETWGALLAAFQARNASDADIRAAQAEIAIDERAHAELAWRIDAWVRPRLPPAARARVDAARARAARTLEREVRRFGVGQPALGLPNATQAQALLRGLGRALWRSAPASSRPRAAGVRRDLDVKELGRGARAARAAARRAGSGGPSPSPHRARGRG